MRNEDIEREVIDSFFTDKTLLKIKNFLSIGKILFAFADMKDAKNKKIDFYMDAADCLVLVKKILSYRIEKQLLESVRTQTETKSKYAQEVWNSKTLPTDSEKTIFKDIHIGPSVLNGYQLNFRAKQDKLQFNIPIATYDDLLAFAEKAYYVLDDYMKHRYTVENTTSEYARGRSSENANKQNVTIDKKKDIANSNNNATPSLSQNDSVDSPVLKMHCKNESDVKTASNGDYYMKVSDKASNNVYILYIPKKVVNTCPEWKSFNSSIENAIAQKKCITFSISYKKTGIIQNKLEKLSFVNFNS